MDPYVFVRFLFMMVKAFVPIWFFSWIILFPITTVGTSNNKEKLDRFTYGNIGPSQQSRLWAHLILDYVFICKWSRKKGISDDSLDHLPHLARNATLAGRPTTLPSLKGSLEIAPSEYGSHHRDSKGIYG